MLGLWDGRQSIPRPHTQYLLMINQLDLTPHVEKFVHRLKGDLTGKITGVAVIPPLSGEKDGPGMLSDHSIWAIFSEPVALYQEKLQHIAGEVMGQGSDLLCICLADIWSACLRADYTYVEGIGRAQIIYDEGVLSRLQAASVCQKAIAARLENLLMGYFPSDPQTLITMAQQHLLDTGLLSGDQFQTLLEIYTLRKNLEHGTKTAVTGAEIDHLYQQARTYKDHLLQLSATLEAETQYQAYCHTRERIIQILTSWQKSVDETDELVAQGLIAASCQDDLQQILATSVKPLSMPVDQLLAKAKLLLQQLFEVQLLRNKSMCKHQEKNDGTVKL